MTKKILHIQASPRQGRSKSARVATSFLNAYRAANPDDEVTTLDLWNTPLPEFDGAAIEAKYHLIQGQAFGSDEAVAWQTIVDHCDAFKSADKYVFSLPMWNFGIPYKLKHYIDIIVQPGQTFGFSPEAGYAGLITGKPVLTIYARGDTYRSDAAAAMDFQQRYLDHVLGFIGFTDIREIVVEPTFGSPGDVQLVEAAAIQEAERVARQF